MALWRRAVTDACFTCSSLPVWTNQMRRCTQACFVCSQLTNESSVLSSELHGFNPLPLCSSINGGAESKSPIMLSDGKSVCYRRTVEISVQYPLVFILGHQARP
jgi:hypothetical protein